MSIFTKIINREIPAEIIFENDVLIVIRDINPKAKVHLLIIPKKEIYTINDLGQEDTKLIAEMFFTAQKVAKNMGVSEGYKLNFNVGEKGGQEVMHIHMHLLSDI
ncbi:histidine triad nucleotide-binding protein [Candidatus Gracilibacteria bacterium 28_42_T64]|nr:histidine triad nucleotide-binding protein [Candidatus Gracilibacteria bacterium 28_42_T64]